ncbi:hypothetical protein QBC32DRAFT_91608 [Pseudoneurospora amorphoporcata]|uniref:Uncharacterized protein n=1 Tax=Pseudoneurospora amorphoporcata TaxID=241081 RepID=A0AAN6NLZ4_9PEZI|nr:hypothetical protein QBC32DRAFT_91608 [Pseudoneurospora amorphoporcata]
MAHSNPQESSVSSFQGTDDESTRDSARTSRCSSQAPTPISSEDSVVKVEFDYVCEKSRAAPGDGNLVIKYPVSGSRRSHLKAMEKNAKSIQHATRMRLKFDEFIDKSRRHAVRLDGLLIKSVTPVERTERQGRKHLPGITYKIDLGSGKELDAEILQSIIGVGVVVGHTIEAIPRVMDCESWQTVCDDMVHRPSLGSGKLSRPGTAGSRRSRDASAASSRRSRSIGETGTRPSLAFPAPNNVSRQPNRRREVSPLNMNMLGEDTLPGRINVSPTLPSGAVRRQRNISGESSLSGQRSVPEERSELEESAPCEMPQESGSGPSPRPQPQPSPPGRRRRCKAFLSKAGKALKRWIRRSC